ncbi:fam-b protein [Plasmodium vinckei]|uniref:Fam-b protein n=1 Tax=Plasmodium vinckei TaxID=5860 RepID=A0A6V7T9N6_PLAVN|nr:fam-b protein [Plasmodium vinckei]
MVKCKKLINNRILADVNNQFYLNNFYESKLNIVDAFNDEGIKCIQNVIDKHIKKCMVSNMLFKLKGINMGMKILIHKVVMKLSKIPKKKNKLMMGCQWDKHNIRQ